MIARRPVLAGLALALGSGPGKGMAMAEAPYGMIARITAQPGKRGELLAILGGGTQGMPGCLAYVVSEDARVPDAVWVTEYWDSKASHEASLALPAVKDAIARGRPLIAGFESAAELRPVSGVPGQ